MQATTINETFFITRSLALPVTVISFDSLAFDYRGKHSQKRLE